MRRGTLAILIALTLLVPPSLVGAQEGGAQADLEVDDIELEPEDPQPGDNVTFEATIENAGEADAGAFNVTFQVNGSAVGEPVHVDGLGAGNETTATSEAWTAEAGDHVVRVHVDADAAVNESNEGNNIATESFEVRTAEEDDDEDTDDGADDDRRRDRDRPRMTQSSFDRDNDTFTGDHVAFRLDTELPGIRAYTILDGNVSVFDLVQIPDGNDTEWTAQRGIFAMDTESGELMLRDTDDYHLAVEAENGSATLELSDGVSAERNDTFSEDDDDEAVYQLHLPDNRTLWLWGEGLSLHNGTFAVSDEVRLGASFPAADAHERMQERREQMEERREEMRERVREAGSQWDRSNETFEGKHVRFTLDEDAPGIRSYTLLDGDVTVFDDVLLPNGTDTRWRAHGVNFELRTDDEGVRVLDIPPAVLLVRGSEDGPATVTLSDGVDAERVDDGEDDERAIYRLNLTGNKTAWLAGEEISLDNGTITVHDKLTFRLRPADPDASENRGPGSLPDEARERGDDDEDDDRGPPEHARARAMGPGDQMEIERAIAAGNVSVEVHVSENDTEPVAIEMGHVEVRRALADPQGPVKASVQIEAPDDAPGTVVTLNLNASDLGNLTVNEASERLTVAFDNETIEPADDLKDVLDWKNDDGEAEFLLLVGGDKVQVLVSVPHFSPHTIEVQSVDTQSEETTTNGAPGVGAIGAVVAAALGAALLAARKED